MAKTGSSLCWCCGSDDRCKFLGRLPSMASSATVCNDSFCPRRPAEPDSMLTLASCGQSCTKRAVAPAKKSRRLRDWCTLKTTVPTTLKRHRNNWFHLSSSQPASGDSAVVPQFRTRRLPLFVRASRTNPPKCGRACECQTNRPHWRPGGSADGGSLGQGRGA